MAIELPQDFKEFLKLLTAHQVDYLLIGGFAVGYHGYPRATNDIDIWVKVDSGNASKLVSVIEEFARYRSSPRTCSFRQVKSFAWVSLQCELRF